MDITWDKNVCADNVHVHAAFLTDINIVHFFKYFVSPCFACGVLSFEDRALQLHLRDSSVSTSPAFLYEFQRLFLSTCWQGLCYFKNAWHDSKLVEIVPESMRYCALN